MSLLRMQRMCGVMIILRVVNMALLCLSVCFAQPHSPDFNLNIKHKVHTWEFSVYVSCFVEPGWTVALAERTRKTRSWKVGELHQLNQAAKGIQPSCMRQTPGSVAKENYVKSMEEYPVGLFGLKRSFIHERCHVTMSKT